MRATDKKVIAIACADLHLSHKPPAARAGEKDWYAAMKRQLDQLSNLKNKYRVPILCAGDVFHLWNSPPELINFTIDHLPQMYAVPGQHDLPNHSFDDIEKSAYTTLVKSKIIMPLSAYGAQIDFETGTARVCGFGWGEDVADPPPVFQTLNIVVVHEYTWKECYGHPGALNPLGVVFPKKYHPYDVVITGDNHKSFDYTFNRRMRVLNVGSFMRTAADQTDHKPSVGLIHADGTATRHYLDISMDVFEPTAKETPTAESPQMQRFLAEMKILHSSTLDFAERLNQVLGSSNTSHEVKRHIQAALDGDSL